jgi:hypothetical protein
MPEIEQLIRFVAQTVEDLQQAHSYISQLGDLTEFITQTARDAWKDVPKIVEAFGRAGK